MRKTLPWIIMTRQGIMNKFFKVSCVALALAFTVGATACTPTIEDNKNYDTVLNERLEPLWNDGGTSKNETAIVIANEVGEIDPIQLLYPITEIVSVTNFAQTETYVEGTDYTVEDGNLVIDSTGAIPYIEYSEFFFDKYEANGNMWPLAKGKGGQLKTEAEKGGRGLTEWQVSVTYKHSDVWDGPVPEDKSENFVTTRDYLSNGDGVSIVCLGDSISAGWTASGYEYVDIEPFCPPYFELVTNYMEQLYGNVTATNLSVGGMASSWGTESKQLKAIKDERPDLLIIGFGMNDGSATSTNGGGVSTKIFKSNIEKIIDGVWKYEENCEIVLVSTMLPNEEVGSEPGVSIYSKQKEYLAVLNEIEAERENVAVADVTSLHEYLLTRKQFRDMSSNNINHPNDYVHRLYAQTVLQTIFGKIEKVEKLPEV